MKATRIVKAHLDQRRRKETSLPLSLEPFLRSWVDIYMSRDTARKRRSKVVGYRKKEFVARWEVFVYISIKTDVVVGRLRTAMSCGGDGENSDFSLVGMVDWRNTNKNKRNKPLINSRNEI